MKYTIKSANACYTGCNIYLFYGQLTDNTYFLFDNDYFYIGIADSDTSDFENSLMSEWQDEHVIDCLSDDAGEEVNEERKTFVADVLKWILRNKPNGNYTAGDIEGIYKMFTGHKYLPLTGDKPNVRILYEATYAPGSDMTFILRHVCIDEVITETKITGFYCGEPDKQLTEQYKHSGILLKH